MTNPVSVPRELLPCPFCGNDLQVSQHRYNPWARCITENCKGAQLPLLNIELPEDVERWNRRAAPVAAPSQDDVRDAERYRWLTDDHESREQRAARNKLCARLPVMSYSAASVAIDAAIAAHQHEQEKGDE